MKLSVILITRNQEWNITRIVSSVKRATEGFADTEIVLVDSASSDRTVSLARDQGIDVLALSDDQVLTAAAGRYVGFNHTSGDYVLFLDGDMELAGPWLEQATATLDRDPTIAAVGGRRIDLPPTTKGSGAGHVEIDGRNPTSHDTRHAGGSALYRRSVLDEVGTFNPFIFSDEEPELCIRIRYRGGYRVVRLDTPVGYHFSDPIDELATLIGRSRRNLYVGAGQNLRTLIGTDLFLPYVRERGFGLPVIAWGSVGVAAALGSILSRRWIPIVAWFGLTTAAVGVEAIRERSMRKAIHSALKRWLIARGTVRGFLMPPHTPDEYPARLVNER